MCPYYVIVEYSPELEPVILAGIIINRLPTNFLHLMHWSLAVPLN